MGFARRTLRFGSGLVLGVAVGTTVSVLFAPQRGDELKASFQDRREEALRAGEEAELIETERLKNVFRATVSDPTALTGRTDPSKREKTEAEKAAEKLEQERKEAEKALSAERKAQAAVRKAREQAEKDQAKIRKAQQKADKARDTLRSEEEDVSKAYNEAVEKSQQQ
jgi:gas vesicle protein